LASQKNWLGGQVRLLILFLRLIAGFSGVGNPALLLVDGMLSVREALDGHSQLSVSEIWKHTLPAFMNTGVLFFLYNSSTFCDKISVLLVLHFLARIKA
jgi:hypothetical protein